MVPADGGHDLAHHLIHRRLMEALGMLVVGRAGHAAIAVAQPIYPLQAQGLRCAA